MITQKFTTVDAYIDAFSGIHKKKLEEMRKIVKQAAPKNATEVISYNMPAIKTSTVLVYYAAYEKHIGFYPTGSPITVFADRLGEYKTSKGAVQFPLDAALPKKLIGEMIAYRATTEAGRAQMKQAEKNKKKTVAKK
ncbi:iron chaperone [Niabella hirudinis]|uniref:iron chaperone n=1 Tax=Niabella hirudinis TaxID=1285929 RepID=UPI003EC0D445